MRPCFLLAVLLICPAFSQAQPIAPPTFKVVAYTDKEKGQVFCGYCVMVPLTVQKQVFEFINGQKVMKVVNENRERAVFTGDSIDLAKSRVITPDGKQLALDEAMKRLKANDVVAVAANSNTPAPVFLRALNPNTLVIIPPPQVPAPMPIPVPPKKMP